MVLHKDAALLCSALVMLTACKTARTKEKQPQETRASEIHSKQATTEKQEVQNYLDLIKRVKEEKKTLEDEFKDLKAAVAEYKESQYFKSPATEEDEGFNSLVAALDQLSLKQIKEYVKQGKFSAIQQDAEKNLQTYMKTALDMQKAVNKAQGKEDADDEDASASGNSSGAQASLALAADEGPSKPRILQDTGIALIVLGAVGIVSYGVLNQEGLRKLNVKANGLGIFALVVGSLLVAQSSPNDDTVKATQALLYIYAGSIGLTALNNLWGMTTGIRIRELPSTEVGKITYATAPTSRIRSFGRFLLAGGVVAGLVMWAKSMDLANTLTLRETLIAKINRFFLLLQEYEKELGKGTKGA